jgi:transcriptional regulator with XRE-family HTH domain
VQAKIGSIIRRLRKTAKMSQMELAENVGVSYQQLQKYEYGKCGLTVDRLSQICHALNITLFEFFQHTEVSGNKVIKNVLGEDEQLLLQYFKRIKRPAQRKSLLRMAEDIANSVENNES